jgi:hypothetical protein
MSFNNLQWLFAIAVTLHNLEEGLWFPQWSQKVSGWPHPVGKFPFRLAAIVLTGLAYFLAYLSALGGKGSLGAYLLAGYGFAMLVNVFFPHAIATARFRQYMPGLATALLLNLPITAALLYCAVTENYVELTPLAIVAVLVALTLVALIQGLFKLGKGIENLQLFTK